jgi:hypothetical protein
LLVVITRWFLMSDRSLPEREILPVGTVVDVDEEWFVDGGLPDECIIRYDGVLYAYEFDGATEVDTDD